MICFILKKTFDTGLDIRGSNSKVYKNESHHREDFEHRDFPVCSGVVGVFYFERHTYNYSDNVEQALISPKCRQSLWDRGSSSYPLARSPAHQLCYHVFVMHGKGIRGLLLSKGNEN